MATVDLSEQPSRIRNQIVQLFHLRDVHKCGRSLAFVARRPRQPNLFLPTLGRVDIVSRVHALIRLNPNADTSARSTADKKYSGFTIRDLKSTNGVSINGQRAPAGVDVPMFEGDIVVFAPTRPNSHTVVEHQYRMEKVGEQAPQTAGGDTGAGRPAKRPRVTFSASTLQEAGKAASELAVDRLGVQVRYRMLPPHVNYRAFW